MNLENKALILAGGFGTRLRSLVSDLPKSMALVAGKPFLDHQIRYLRDQGIKEFVLAVHYMKDVIESYLKDGKRMGVNITYSEEESPLGTAGAIKNAEKYLKTDNFFVFNGDSYTNLNLSELSRYHQEKGSNFTIGLINSEDTSRYGTVILENGRITDFSEKKESKNSGLINTGVYLFNPRIFDLIEPGKKVSLEEEIFPRLAKEGMLYGYTHEGTHIDIGTPEGFHKFRRDVLERIVMDQGDNLRNAMKKISESGINLVLVVDNNRNLLGVANNGIITEYILKGGDLNDKLEKFMVKNPITARDSDDESKVYSLLSSGINHIPILDENGRLYDVRFRSEEIKRETFPTLQGKAPLRISFAGGGTDLSYFFEKYGGVVVNATIDKYCHATIQKRADKKILIGSDLEKELLLNSDEIKYDGNFDLIKAVTKIISPSFGFEIYLHNDLPSGKGLGSSASLGVLTAKLISELEGFKLGDDELAKIAFRAETEELGIKGGWQDQYAAVTGGFGFMEFNKDKIIVYPLRLKEDIINEFNSHLLLCSVGNSHFSGEQHRAQEENFYEKEEEVLVRLNSMKEDAINIRDYLLMGNLGKIGELLNKSWESKKKLSSLISNPKIDELYQTGMDNGAIGGKLLGAGGGGYILFFYSPKKRKQLRDSLKEKNGEIVDFNFESEGVKVWQVQENYLP